VKFAQIFEASKMAVEMTSCDKHTFSRQVKDTDFEVRLASLEQKIKESTAKSDD